MNRREFGLLSLSTLASLSGASLLQRAASAQAGGFFFKDGDRIVMIGDSITEQHQHSNYVEIYTLTRFPGWKLAFRNAGIGGDTSTGGNRRTERDVLSFNPTACTITFGMNDAGYKYPPDPPRLEAYRTGLQGMLTQLKAKNVRTAVLSSSPVEKKEDGRALEGYNQTLEIFATNAKEVATQNGFPFVDQFHPHLAALQKARDESAAARINGGDAVHPGGPGQLMMAWAILKGLGAPSLVSSATIDAAAAKTTATSACTVTGVKKRPDGIAFLRADQALPMWVQPEAAPILKWVPFAQDLDQYTLKVTGLPAGTYRLVIDDQPCGMISASDLAAGYNMALLNEGPISAQAQRVHHAVWAKNAYYHDKIFRGVTLNNGVPEAQKAAQIEEAMKGMPALEQAVRDALVLRPHRFELVKAA